ncbi:MAG: hypothetical protein WKG00_33290 [Polyangiaceae bacterium]
MPLHRTAPSRVRWVATAAMLLLAAGALAVGCGGSAAPDPRPPSPRLLMASAGSPLASARVRPPPERPPPEALAVDPDSARQFLAGFGDTPVPLLAIPEAPKVTLLSLQQTADGEAPSMKADPVAGGLLVEGQRATAPLAVAAGECVTVIAQGGLGIVELDLFLTAKQESRIALLAQDAMPGPIAVIGGKARCFSAPPGAPAIEVSVRARRGAGVVLTRVYRR